MKTLHLSIIVILLLSAACLFFTSFHNEAYADLTTRLAQTIASKNHVYVTWDSISNGNFSVMFTQSSDYGTTFGKTIKLADNVGFSVPRKIAASENNVYLAWATDTKNNHSVFLAKSTDYGNTFELAVMLSDQNTLCNSVTGLQATGPYVYIFFNCYNSASQEGSIVFRASHDNATSFGKSIMLFKGKGIYSNIFLSTAAQGNNVYVVSEKDYDISHPDMVLFRKSTDAGDTFSQAVDLGNNQYSHVDPQVIPNNNHVYVIWRDYHDNYFKDLEFTKSDDFGTTFGSLEKLNTDKPDTEMYNIPFLEFNNNKVYVSWEEIHQGPVQTQYQLLRTSTDGRNTFGPEQNLTDVISMNYNLQQGGIAVGTGQNLYYLYPGMSNPTFDIASVFFKKSQDGAMTFGTQVDLNKLNFAPHDMYDPQITVSENNVYVTADTLDKGREIFFVSSHDNGTTFGKVVNINDFNSTNLQRNILSPLKQLESGIPAQNIKCQDDLELVIKSSNKSPACVRHSSLARLLYHGWVYGISDYAQEASKKTTEIVIVGDIIPGTNGLVPVTGTEITNHSESLDSLTVWDFLPIGLNGDNIHTTWDILPQNYSKFYTVLDPNGNDIIDYSRLPEPFTVTLELRTYPAVCGSEKVVGEGGHPPVMPIKKGNSEVLAEYADKGLLPDSNGEYTLKFLSFFDTKLELPKNAIVISNQTESCFLEPKMDNFTKAFYTKAVFRLD